MEQWSLENNLIESRSQSNRVRRLTAPYGAEEEDQYFAFVEVSRPVLHGRFFFRESL